MGMTGHRNEVSGIYRSSCSCKEEIALTQGKPFPPCRHCKKAVNWALVRRTVQG
jgi:hypothetical protein